MLLLVTRSDVLGGAQRHVADLARGLVAAGDDVMLACGGDGAVYKDLVAVGVQLHCLPWLQRSLAPLDDLRCVPRLMTVIRQLAPDVVHGHSTKAGLLGVLAARAVGVRALFTAHGWSAISAARGGRVGVAAAIACHQIGLVAADRVLVLSRHDEAIARRMRLCRRRALAVLPPPVRDDPRRADPSLAPARIITIARHDWPKDGATLIKALAGLSAKPWSLIWLGSGPQLAADIALAHRLGIAERIDFCGHVDDVSDVLASGQLFVLSSRAEGLPLALIEAQRAGLGAVASDVGAVAACIGGGDSGSVVPAGDVLALRAALGDALGDPVLRQRWGRAARQAFADRPDPDALIARLRAYYRGEDPLTGAE